MPTIAPTGEGENFDPPSTPALRLEQTGDSTIAPLLSLACSDTQGTTDNTWYRVFPLSEFGISETFTVNRINFAVQTAIGDQRVQVSIGTYDGAPAEALDTSKIDLLAMTTVKVPPTTKGEMLQANFAQVDIPANANLVVQVHSSGHTDKIESYFYLGATRSTETVPGYLSAPACNTPAPTMTSALGYLQTHLIIAVSGTH